MRIFKRNIRCGAVPLVEIMRKLEKYVRSQCLVMINWLIDCESSVGTSGARPWVWVGDILIPYSF